MPPLMVPPPAIFRLETRLARLSDSHAAFATSVILFALAGWQQLLVHLPPYQDLPDHLATAVVLMNPDRYPEFIPTGFLHSNTLLPLFLLKLGPVFGLIPAARIFIVAIIVAWALVLPRFVLAFAGRRSMVLAAPLMVPMVHNWWISMGMLNFALAIPLSLGALIVQKRQIDGPFSLRRAAALAAAFAGIAFIHSLPILFCGLLCGLHALLQPDWKHRWRTAVRLLAPLAPAASLLIISTALHLQMARATPQFSGETVAPLRALLPLAYELWGCFFFQYSLWTVSTLATALILIVYGVRRRRLPFTFFSTPALLVLLALYLFVVPSQAPAMGYLGARFIPFIWLGLLLRTPATMPHWVQNLSVIAALLWSMGLAADFREAQAHSDTFASGIPYVRKHARMLSLNFDGSMDRNVAAVTHGQGLYVVARQVNAQDVWADSPNMPIFRAGVPDPIDDASQIDLLKANAANPTLYCRGEFVRGLSTAGCEARWAALWKGIWANAQTRKDYVLLWAAPPELLGTLPKHWRIAHERGPLRLLETLR